MYLIIFFKKIKFFRFKMAVESKKLSKEFLKKLLRSDFKLYYSTPSLNDQLYLHYKGILLFSKEIFFFLKDLIKLRI